MLNGIYKHIDKAAQSSAESKALSKSLQNRRSNFKIFPSHLRKRDSDNMTIYLTSRFKKIIPRLFSGTETKKYQKHIRQSLIFKEGLANKQTIVLDGPNLEKSFRKQLLYFVKNYPNYKKVIYDFGHGNQETLNKIAEERQYRTYEQWSQEFYENITPYEKPTLDEGFDEII